MISEALVEKARQRLDAGESQRAVAQSLHLSRGTVWNIARGQWRPKRSPSGAGDLANPPPYEKCPDCHCLVTLPCVRCRVLEALEAGRLDRVPDDLDDLRLALRPADLQRYHEVLAAREAGQPIGCEP